MCANRKTNMNRGGKLAVRLAAWLIIIGGTALLSDMVGPFRGWIARLGDQMRAAETPSLHREDDGAAAADEARETADTDAAASGVPQPPDGQAPPRHASATDAAAERSPTAETALEKEFEKTYKRILADLPQPEVGKTYAVRTKEGDVVRGELKAVKPGRIFLRLRYGTLAMPIDLLHPREVPRFFPSREARRRALDALAARTNQRKTPKPTTPARQEDQPAQGEDAIPAGAVGEDAASGARASSGPPTAETVSFRPVPEKSDPAILPLVKNFAGWLEVQHRRIGGKVADTAFAHRRGNTVILYLVIHPQFLAQDYELRFQFAESLWQFWAFRAQDFGVVSSPEDAYIVLLDSKRKRIGGSRRTSASDVWVEGGQQTISAQR